MRELSHIWDKVNLIWSIWSPLLHFKNLSAPWKVYISLHYLFWCTLSNCVTWEFKALFVNVESGVKRGRNCKWRCYRLFSRPLQSLNGGIFCPQQITKVWRGQLYNFLCSLNDCNFLGSWDGILYCKDNKSRFGYDCW